MNLVEDWKRAHKWASVRIAAVLATVSVAYDYFPAVQSYVAPYVSPKTMAIISVVIIAARVISFGKKIKQ